MQDDNYDDVPEDFSYLYPNNIQGNIDIEITIVHDPFSPDLATIMYLPDIMVMRIIPSTNPMYILADMPGFSNN